MIRRHSAQIALGLLLSLLWTPITTTAVTITGGPARISGGNVPIGGPTVIYSVRLGPPPGGQDVIRVGVQVNAAGPRPLTSADVRRLRLFADTNGDLLFQPSVDTFMGEATTVPLNQMVNIVDATPSEPTAPNNFFFITIEFFTSAAGKTFTVEASTPPDNIAVTTPPPGGPTADGGIGPGAVVTIDPLRGAAVGLEWLVGLAFVGYGVYRLKKDRPEKNPAA